MKISEKQKIVLHSFYFHCYNVYHNGSKKMFGFHMKQMDKLEISWHIQNVVSELAEDIKSRHYYFSTLLEKKGIKVACNK